MSAVSITDGLDVDIRDQALMRDVESLTALTTLVERTRTSITARMGALAALSVLEFAIYALVTRRINAMSTDARREHYCSWEDPRDLDGALDLLLRNGEVSEASMRQSGIRAGAWLEDLERC